MKKYMLLYNGPATPMEEMTEEQGQEVMAAWGAWIERVGAAMVDVGAPTANGVAVVDNGSQGNASQINGYTILQAEDVEAAKSLVEGHPFLKDQSGKFSIEIHELLPVPGM